MKVKYRTKYGNVKVRIDGHNFDSKKEANRYRELLLLTTAGEIAFLELQPKYELLAGFQHRGVKYRAVTYTADFRYRTQSGQIIVEDVKSWITKRKADYVLRKKLFLMQHPEIVFRET